VNIEAQSQKVQRKLLKRPLSAAELAQRAGFPHARALSRALGQLKTAGEVTVVPGRPTKYSRP
jgi:sugar-specific transcriptional regulator TrmB